MQQQEVDRRARHRGLHPLLPGRSPLFAAPPASRTLWGGPWRRSLTSIPPLGSRVAQGAGGAGSSRAAPESSSGVHGVDPILSFMGFSPELHVRFV